MNNDDPGITRRDFLNGVGLTLASTAISRAIGQADPTPAGIVSEEYFLARGISPGDPRYYPPALTGMRGSHPGAFEAVHALRDGGRWDAAVPVVDTEDPYDLVIVGAGISGLTAAYEFRREHGPETKILLLDNHDDFGGHAKRNEFNAGGRILIGYGGTQSIEVLGLYTPRAMGLLRDLGIDLQKFQTFYDQGFRHRNGLKAASFFDRSQFGVDRLCIRESDSVYFGHAQDPREVEAFLAQVPLAAKAKDDLRRLYFGRVDYLAGKSKAEKISFLEGISLSAFLTQHLKVHPDVLKYFEQRSHGLFGVGIDAVAALSGMLFMPEGLVSALDLRESGGGAMSKEPYIYHFPDGNASVARLLVRYLIPKSASGSTMEDIVTARMNYAALDQADSHTRLRLNSTVVRVMHNGDPGQAKTVDVHYLNAGKRHVVRGQKVILACWNMVIPYLCPELPAPQREALSYSVKVPLVYGTVQLRNWTALKKLGVGSVYCAGSYFSEVNLDLPVSIGHYQYPSKPEDPCLLHLVRTPCKPGLPVKDQYRAGRAELLTTPFSTFEHHVRDQLARMFGPGGFEASRDIQAITINRWPHGYAYEYSTLWDPKWPKGQAPHEIGRQRFGRIAIANADSGAIAETSCAIEQALRACSELAQLDV